MRRKKDSLLLTEVELEFMNILWDLGQGGVQDILDKLGPQRQLAYTSAATIMRILEEKDFVTSTKVSRMYCYTPNLSKEAHQTRLLQSIAHKAFDNTPVNMVARLIEGAELSEENLEEIRKILDSRSPEK